ncbi:ANTAR domain-containing protein [Amycolatopsis speibonae]|uniref:ANTAR domain-containing protein n=1 Tax=Amycolatopsis speibonae TaxID=1450224 RepID=A0ABV7NZ65_9PSEU
MEQAKGVLVATLGIDVEEAFQWLRAHAQERQLKLADLSARVARGEIPAELITPF